MSEHGIGLIGVSVIAIMSSSWSVLAQPSTDHNVEARQLYEEGRMRIESFDPAGAIPLLVRSLELVPRTSTAYTLALAHARIGHMIQAEQIGQSILEGEYGEIPTEELRELILQLLNAARDQVAVLEVRAPNLPGLHIALDGDPLAHLEGVARSRVDPGDHRVSVTATDRQSFEQPIRVLPRQPPAVIQVPDLPYRPDRVPATLVVIASRPEASIEIVEVSRGQGELEETLPPGPYEIRVRFEEREVVRHIVLGPGESRELEVDVSGSRRARRWLRIALPLAAAVVAGAVTAAVVVGDGGSLPASDYGPFEIMSND